MPPLAVLASRALGEALDFLPGRLPRAIPARLADEAFKFARLDKKSLLIGVLAGVERLHVYDLEALCDAVDADVSAAWRVWREDMIGLDGRPLPLPAPERSSLPLPECYVETGGDGVPTLTEDCDRWLRVFERFVSLRALSLETGARGDEGAETEAKARRVLRGVAEAGGLERLSIAFFDSVTDATLEELWGRKTSARAAAKDGALGRENKTSNKSSSGAVKQELKQELRSRRNGLPPSRTPPPPRGAPPRAPRFGPRSLAGRRPRSRAPPAPPSSTFASPLRVLSRLDLSHLPRLTDASVAAALAALPSLRMLRLEFLAVTDACLGAARAGGWRDALRGLEWLEVKACPYVRFAHPGVDFRRPPPRLKTLRIQPGGKPTNATRKGGGGGDDAENVPENVSENNVSAHTNNKGPRGGADMWVSARHVHQLALAGLASPIERLCLGCRFAGASRSERFKLGVRGNLGGYRAEDLLDLRACAFPTLTRLELYRCADQIAWPARFADVSDRLESLVLETPPPSDGLGLARRLGRSRTLRRLVVCDCSSMGEDAFEALGELGGGGAGAGPRLEVFVVGGVRGRLAGLARGVVRRLRDAPGSRLRVAHVHERPEYPGGEGAAFDDEDDVSEDFDEWEETRGFGEIGGIGGE